MLLSHTYVFLAHIVLVAPLLIYLWFRGVHQNKPLNKQLLTAIGALGVLTLLYHGYRLYTN